MTNATRDPSSQLMIRTKENLLTGPFPREELIRRVSKGELREGDEICAGNGYWISLHEREECQALLGVMLPRSEDFHTEKTEPGTESKTITATRPVEGENIRPAAGGPHPAYSIAPPTPRNPNAAPNTVRPQHRETVGTLRMVLWGVFALIAFVLFQVFRITRGF